MAVFSRASRGIIISIFIIFTIASAYAAAPAAVSPDGAVQKLKDGNIRYTSGKRIYPNQTAARRKATTDGQTPFAAVLTCSDSRVPAEHIFDAGIGDIFVIRDAGNVASSVEIGSAEYAVEHIGAPVLVVMGHSGCGAVTAAVKGDKTDGSITDVIDLIMPSVDKAKAVYGNKFSQQLLDEAIKLNVYQTMQDLLAKSDIISKLVQAKKIKVIGALYHLDTGAVEWLGEHPMQDESLYGENGQPVLTTPVVTKDDKPVYAVKNATGKVVSGKIAENNPPLVMKKEAGTVSGIQFFFNKKLPLQVSPRKPLYITVSVSVPDTVKTVALKVYAEPVNTGKRKLIFSLPAVRAISGRAQAQIYWAAWEFKKGYVPKGSYYIYGEAEGFDSASHSAASYSHYPLPKKAYIITVN